MAEPEKERGHHPPNAHRERKGQREGGRAVGNSVNKRVYDLSLVPRSGLSSLLPFRFADPNLAFFYGVHERKKGDMGEECCEK